MIKNLLFIFATAIMLSSCGRTNPNEWVLATGDCWNNIEVLKAGQMLPRSMTTCDRAIILPATELAAEFVIETKFKNRLAGTVAMTYQWTIVDPIAFSRSAKSLVSTSAGGTEKIDPDKLESIENSVVDKLMADIVRGYTPGIDAKDINELIIEKDLQALADRDLLNRGVQYSNMSVNVDLSPQAEEALDVISALQFYRDNGEEELGRRIIEAKAGATNISVQK